MRCNAYPALTAAGAHLLQGSAIPGYRTEARLMPRIVIREATAADAPGLAPVLASLGYPASEDFLRSKLHVLIGGPDDRVFVADIDGHLAGVLSFHRIPLFHAPGYAGRITVLAVLPSAQRSGVGRALVGAAEEFGWTHDCARIEVTSGDQRAEAHAFYARVGYQADERRFLKHRPR